MDRVLVVGGGITGIQAALDLAQMGCEVTLLEKEDELGGKLRHLSKLFPREESADELLRSKRTAIEKGERVRVMTGAEIKGVESEPSGFKVALTGKGDSLQAGAVVIATGFDPFDPGPIEEYGYGRLKDVITAFELEEMLKADQVARPSDGSVPHKVAFLQCVGSRDRRTNRYCSSFCCTYAIKEALALKKRTSESEISIMYMDIRTPYLYEHLYTEAREAGVQFIRSRVSGIREHEGLLELEVENTLLRESGTFLSELVVLSTGGIPSATTSKLADQFKLPRTDQGFFRVEEAPVETAARGVFIAGTASGLKDIPHCLAEASASALYAATFLRERTK